MVNRYSTDQNPETALEPGSRGRVLANRLGIIRVRDMQEAESERLLRLVDELLAEISDRERITSRHIVDWHRRWLGDIYSWAGQYRQVNIGKADSNSPQLTSLDL